MSVFNGAGPERDPRRSRRLPFDPGGGSCASRKLGMKIQMLLDGKIGATEHTIDDELRRLNEWPIQITT